MKRFLFVLAIMFLGMVPTPILAETLKEAVDRQAKQAEVDRKAIPIFAVSVEALKAGRELPGMPAILVQAACAVGGASTYRTVGKSEVTIDGEGAGFVTFTIRPHASTAPDETGTTHSLFQPDPIEELIGWVYGVQTTGIVFAKTKDGTSLAVPSFQTCLGFTLDGREVKNIPEVCRRFGLDNVVTARVMKTTEDTTNERAFLVSLMASYGVNGVLYRETLEKELGRHMARIHELVKGTTEKTGYIKYNRYSGSYEAETTHLLQATIHDSDSRIEPNGYVEVAVHVYSERVEGVQVELRYEDGTAIANTGIGNMARATLTRADLVTPEDSVSSFEIVKIRLPETLETGKIRVIASAVDTKGNLVVRDEPIGTFEYAAQQK